MEAESKLMTMTVLLVYSTRLERTGTTRQDVEQRRAAQA